MLSRCPVSRSKLVVLRILRIASVSSNVWICANQRIKIPKRLLKKKKKVHRGLNFYSRAKKI